LDFIFDGTKALQMQIILTSGKQLDESLVSLRLDGKQLDLLVAK
jgi:hypothetical protein